MISATTAFVSTRDLLVFSWDHQGIYTTSRDVTTR